MQEHDMSFVRAEMTLAQKPPRTETGAMGWLQKNLFASGPDIVLTLIALILLGLVLPAVVRWAFVDAQWFGVDRSACATAAQGGTQPEGWSGACWAFVSAKFQSFMFGTYPYAERWRVVLTGILFVALLVPLMIPRVPFKSTNAVVFFGIFPVVAFMLLVGYALPFGLFGLVALLIGVIISIIGGVLAFVISIPAYVLQGIGGIGNVLGLPTGFDAFFDWIASAFVAAAYYVDWPFEYASGTVTVIRATAEETLGGQVPSLWTDLALSALLVVGLMIWLGSSTRAIGLTVVAMILSVVALWLTGLDAGLPHVETPLWGGLLVTLVLSFVGIAVSLPLGIVLALGRRSKMPVVKLVCVTFIEAVRGVPLVTVLFMASVMLPLFLPPGTTFDKFLRALIGVALFASAYMAEVIRGGLQAIPKGQYEGADSLGLGYWQKMGLIVLPQALKLVIPGIVNTFIGLFKDTSLVSIIGMFDLLGIVRQAFSDTNWASPQTPMSGLVFAGFVFWLFCFGMSRYSIYMERRLDTGHKR
jgi:general L-amino acid transport system permease protein